MYDPQKSKSVQLNKDNLTSTIKLVGINSILIIAVSFIAGSVIAKARTGSWLFSTQDRKKLLRPENCKEFSCQGFADYNDIIRTDTSPTDEPAFCVVSNPLFGYYNICTKGELGLSKETKRIKPNKTFRVLLVGGSQANINTLALEDELNRKLKETPGSHFDNAEVFGAAIGGGKQPMQLQTANALLGMGYQFNSIVNINGWNEIMLTTWENKKEGIPPIYPRSHVSRLVLEQRVLAADSDILNCTSLDKYFGWHPGYTTWSYQCILNRRKSLSDNQSHGLLRAKLKLDNTRADQESINADGLRAWQVSAQNLSAIASKQDLNYLEVIQPTASTDPENSSCFNKNFSDIYTLPANQLLPKMEGNIVDLRGMSNIDNIFTDCVHLNSRGSQLLAKEVVKSLDLQQKQ